MKLLHAGVRDLEDPAVANIPIVAMTTNAFDEDRRHAIDAGMNAHISKPIDVRQVLQVIRSVIG